MKILTSILLAGLVANAAPGLRAAPETFDFKDPKGVNNAVFKLDAPLESINGSANGISGSVIFDPADPGSLTGKITITTDSLMVPNPMQNKHMHSEIWLDATNYPEITFTSKSLANVKTVENVTTADVTGSFTLKGVTKDITAPVKITYLKDKLSARVPTMKGDLLVIRANFTINREEFNIQPGKYEDKVSPTIDLSLSIAGASVQP